MDENKEESMKRYAEIFQELHRERKNVNEDIKATRESFVTEGHLSKDEVKQVEMAIRLLKGSVDLDDLVEVAQSIESKISVD